MKLTKNKLILIVFTVIVFLSVGYSTFNSSAMIKNIAATVRLNSDIRVTNITINNATTDVVSNYTDYDIKSISSEVYLPSDNSSITYKVSITNFESIEMGIFDITGLPDNLEYSISEYSLKEKICNENNKCNLGITKDIYITIKYKNGKNESDNNLHNFKLEFDFRSYHKVNYKNIYGVNYPKEVIDGDKLVLDLEYDDVNLSITNSVGYIYVLDTDYNYENSTLTIPTVNEDLYVEVRDKILITNVISNSDTSETIKYFDNRLNTKVTLSDSISSQQTFNITIYNSTDNSYTFTGVTNDENKYDNKNITFALSGLSKGDIITSGESIQFTLIFKYINGVNLNVENFNNTLNSFLNFNFIEVPVLELSNENELYTNNIYPGIIKEYEFSISNYNVQSINPTPMNYFFEVNTQYPIIVKIYDEENNEVIENIKIEGDSKTKIQHNYKLKLMWDNQAKEFNYDEYKNKEFSSSIVLKATPDSEESLEYLVTKEFEIQSKVSPLYFNVSANNTINMEKESATLPITIKNYNTNTEYNEFETKYKIIVENSEKFEVMIDNKTLTNNIIERTISGGSKKEDNFNIVFKADINTLELTENVKLKIIPQLPYLCEEITLPITIKLQPVTITFNATGGTITQSTKTVYKGKTYEELPTPTWQWHTFNGWYTAESGGTRIFSTSEVTTNNSTQTLYAQWTSHLLVDYASTGDYVNYNIRYNNVATNSNGTHYASLTGWRVLDTQEDTNGEKYVRLIPAGVPMAYRHAASSTTSGQTGVTNLTTNFFNTAISSTGASNTFNACGFQNNLGTIIGIGTLKELFLNNEYTQVKNGAPVVRSMMNQDIESVMKITISNAIDIRDNDLFAIPSSDQESAYASYYLANSAANYYLWASYYSGHIVYTYAYMGVRPIVSLKTNVLTTGKTNNVWQINIE